MAIAIVIAAIPLRTKKSAAPFGTALLNKQQTYEKSLNDYTVIDVRGLQAFKKVFVFSTNN
jgi:hypothetical protein